MGALTSLSKPVTLWALDASEVALLLFGLLLVVGLVGEGAKLDKWKARVRAFQLMVGAVVDNGSYLGWSNGDKAL